MGARIVDSLWRIVMSDTENLVRTKAFQIRKARPVSGSVLSMVAENISYDKGKCFARGTQSNPYLIISSGRWFPYGHPISSDVVCPMGNERRQEVKFI